MRHEFIGGSIYAMAPAGVGQARQAARVASALRSQVEPPCEVFTEGPLLLAADAAIVPDVWVVCSRPDDDSTEHDDTEVIVEVLSPSNRAPQMSVKVEA